MTSQDSYFNKPDNTAMPRAATYSSTENFTPEQRAKILLFETNKVSYLSEFFSKIASALESEEPTILRQGIYVYFVGRANPPHDGHIEGLLMLCLYAIKHGGKAIILLGSGPGGGARTSKDPLDFDLKSSFIKDKLKDRLKNEGYTDDRINEWFTNGTIQIQEMDKPVEQIRGIIREDIIKNLFSEFEAIRLSGAKDGGEDVKKLEWMEKALEAGIIDAEGKLIPIRATVIPVPAVQIEGASKPMSATIIRNIIYDISSPKLDVIPPDEISFFKGRTNNFYVTSGYDYTPAIAAAIYQYKPDPKAVVPKAVVPKAKADKAAAAVKAAAVRAAAELRAAADKALRAAADKAAEEEALRAAAVRAAEEEALRAAAVRAVRAAEEEALRAAEQQMNVVNPKEIIVVNSKKRGTDVAGLGGSRRKNRKTKGRKTKRRRTRKTKRRRTRKTKRRRTKRRRSRRN